MFTITESKKILGVLPKQFDSHDFIRVGALLTTSSFLDLLKQYQGDFTTIDSQIGQFLNRCAQKQNLPIRKIGEQESETIVGTFRKCAIWNKIDSIH